VKPKITDFAVHTADGPGHYADVFKGNKLLIFIADAQKSNRAGLAGIGAWSKGWRAKT
jgi:hypothetical protein